MSSTLTTFSLFPQLPYELQALVFFHAALYATGEPFSDTWEDEKDNLFSSWTFYRPSDNEDFPHRGFIIVAPSSGEKIKFGERTPTEAYAMLKTSRMSKRVMLGVLKQEVENELRAWNSGDGFKAREFVERTAQALEELFQCLK